MTICIGALCANPKGRECRAVVVAADRMVTWGPTEFEHEVPKIMAVGGSATVLVAGNTLYGSRVVRETRAHFAMGVPRVAELADAIAAKYADLRREQLQTDVFGPRGMSMQNFYAGQQTQLVNQLALGLDNIASSFNYGVDLLIAGVDDEGAHLYAVANPGGSSQDFQQIGFTAIGSGQVHALQSMIGFSHTGMKGLRETIFSVYASKRRAEVAPGVGKDTDITVIRENGSRRLDLATLQQLDTLYDDYTKRVNEEVRKGVAKLTLPNDEPTGDQEHRDA